MGRLLQQGLCKTWTHQSLWEELPQQPLWEIFHNKIYPWYGEHRMQALWGRAWQHDQAWLSIHSQPIESTKCRNFEICQGNFLYPIFLYQPCHIGILLNMPIIFSECFHWEGGTGEKRIVKKSHISNTTTLLFFPPSQSPSCLADTLHNSNHVVWTI